MKIIIVNYRFFISGGPERYLFNIIDLLQKKGHSVIPFSIKHNSNLPNNYDKYYLDAIGTGTEVYAHEYKKTSVDTLAKTVGRMFYSFEAKTKLEKLIVDESPDLVYILHYQNKISASIFDAAARHKVPVVLRISDFGQICANALLFRPIEKDICERCVTGSKWNAVKYKCVQSSYAYSAMKAMSLVLAEKVVNVQAKVDAYVVPSSFTLQKLAEYGLDRSKLFHIATYFNNNTLGDAAQISYQPYAVYIGRIVQEKGLLTMIKAFVNTSFKLKIIGFANDDYQEQLEHYLSDKQHNIEFVGRKNFSQIVPYLQTCAFTIVPSEWYDNFPNTILESYAFKKAVIATNLGSLKEMVKDGETGLLFKSHDETDLQQKVAHLLNNLELCEQYGQRAFEKLEAEYYPELHYSKLMSVFEGVLQKRGRLMSI